MEMTKKRIIYTIAVSLIVVFSTTFAILMTLERMDYRNYLLGEYSKSMYELIDSVGNIRVNLGKAAITGSNEQKIITFEDIFRNAALASDRLNSIPISVETAGSANKFLTQVGDFCYSLVRTSTEGKELTDEDYNNIDRLKEQSFKLQSDLNYMLADINQGKVKWGEIRKKVSGVIAKGNEGTVTEKFQGLQKQIAQYPALIYDGPFSDNVLEIQPKINSERQFSENEAKENIRAIIGKDKISAIDKISDVSNAKIDSYRFNISIKGRSNNDKVVCEVTKKGGRVIYLIDNRTIGETKIDKDKAKDLGTKFLENAGYKNMSANYELTYEGYIVVNYIYKQENVLIYPDQIKLKIALDNGDIIGIESEKYLIAHDEKRNIPYPKVSIDDARKKVGKKLEIVNTRLAIIPTETNKEVLCYEFDGSYKDDNFVVYINAQTGLEQKIIQIINTPNGQLTM